jgi:hypothetical protein
MLKTSLHVCSFYRLPAITMLREMAQMLRFFLLTLDFFPWWMHGRIGDWRNLRAAEVYLGRNKFVENALKKTFPRRGVAVRFVAILWLFRGYNLKNKDTQNNKNEKKKALLMKWPTRRRRRCT